MWSTLLFLLLKKYKYLQSRTDRRGYRIFPGGGDQCSINFREKLAKNVLAPWPSEIICVFVNWRAKRLKFSGPHIFWLFLATIYPNSAPPPWPSLRAPGGTPPPCSIVPTRSSWCNFVFLLSMINPEKSPTLLEGPTLVGTLLFGLLTCSGWCCAGAWSRCCTSGPPWTPSREEISQVKPRPALSLSAESGWGG